MSYKIATLKKCKRKKRALKSPACENQPVLMRPRSTTEPRRSKPPGQTEFHPFAPVRAWTWESWHETPSKLPDPWLFDSEALLRELDRCRETVLQIPITNPNATHFGIQLAVNAIYNLTESLRYLLQPAP